MRKTDHFVFPVIKVLNRMAFQIRQYLKQNEAEDADLPLTERANMLHSMPHLMLFLKV